MKFCKIGNGTLMQYRTNNHPLGILVRCVSFVLDFGVLLEKIEETGAYLREK